ncbi:hypothetical protein ES703_120339 [subsurface metagenome]
MNFIRSSMGQVSFQGMGKVLLAAHVTTVTHVPGLFCYQCNRFVPVSSPLLQERGHRVSERGEVSRAD